MTATARLFSWLQDAEFYRDMHLAAADMLADGDRGAWLDVGCGPGVLTRIAADKGYAARGIDRDPNMVEAARRLADERNSPAKFEVSDVATESGHNQRYDVVSASSLLVVLADPAAALGRLIALAKPGGSVLIIEATREMTRRRAFSAVCSGGLGRRAYMLQVWATFRAGRTLQDAVFDQAALRVTHRPLLDGLARASIIRRAR